MAKVDEKQAVFNALRSTLKKYQKKLEVVTDSDSVFYLETHHIMKNKKPLFFASVAVKKNFVSYHLMPVYVHPALLDDVSDELKKRMQGKSCFNFKTLDEALFEELAGLTQACYQHYREEGYV